MSEVPAKRRWFRFSLLTLFVVVTTFCLIAGWVQYQRNWILQRREFLVGHRPNENPAYEDITPAPPPGMLWLFGETGRKNISIVIEGNPGHTTCDEQTSRAKHLFPEAEVKCVVLGKWKLRDHP